MLRDVASYMDRGRVMNVESFDTRGPWRPTVVLITGSLQGGGAERVMTDMANYWRRNGWRITLATWSTREIADFYQLSPDVDRVWLDTSGPGRSIFQKLRWNFLRISRLRKLLLAQNPDAVVSFIDTSNVLTIIAALGLRTHVIVSERNHTAHYVGISWQWSILRRALYARATAVVVQTRDAALWIAEKCKVRAHVIPNPLRLLPDVVAQREPLILAVGSLSRQKGFDVLLRAFGKVQADFADWKVVIIGSGPERSALLELRDSLGLSDRIEFREPVRDVESWMSRAGLVVQPSRYEGFPNVLLEAMGMGAAVISADCPWGPSEIIQDGVNGRLAPVEDADALAHVMAELMSRPEIRARYGEEAMRVRENYRQEKIMAQWEQCILRQS